MIYPVFAIKDNKVGFQPQLLIEQNEASAVRGFAYAVNNQGILNYSPKDFDLYKVGEFNTDSGVFVSVLNPQFVVSGSSVFGDKYINGDKHD